MKMPILYIFALSHIIMKRTETNSNTAESAISHPATPKGIRDIITIGEVNGITDVRKRGLRRGVIDYSESKRSRPIIIGIVANEVSWLASTDIVDRTADGGIDGGIERDIRRQGKESCIRRVS